MNAPLRTKHIVFLLLLVGITLGLVNSKWFKREWAYHKFTSAPTIYGAAELCIGFPDSHRAEQAEGMIWSEISRAPQIPPLKEYLSHLPAGSHHQEAKEILTKLEAEASAREFEALSQGQDLPKMGVFLNAHPDYGVRGRGWLLKRLSADNGHPSAEVLARVFATCKDNTLIWSMAGFKGRGFPAVPNMQVELQARFQGFGLKLTETEEPSLAHIKILGELDFTQARYKSDGQAGQQREEQGQYLSTILTLQIPGGRPLWRREVSASTPDSAYGGVAEATKQAYLPELKKVLTFW